MDTSDSAVINGPELPTIQPSSPVWCKEGRQLLRQYLHEVGYTDTILDVRTKRVRSMLGHTSPECNVEPQENSLGPVLNGGDSPLVKQIEEQIKRNAGGELRDGLTQSVLKMPVLQNMDDDSDEEDDVDSIPPDLSVAQRLSKKQRIKVGGEMLTATNLGMDCETVDALNEFHFLGTGEEEETGGEARGLGDGKELGSHQPKLANALPDFQDLDTLPSIPSAIAGPAKPSEGVVSFYLPEVTQLWSVCQSACGLPHSQCVIVTPAK
uniref:Striatin-3-like n=1 Tax=Callorhinchus milii TaxID=7868 RepID=A0A4W3H0U1_CALMI